MLNKIHIITQSNDIKLECQKLYINLQIQKAKYNHNRAIINYQVGSNCILAEGLPWKEYPVKYGVMFSVDTAMDATDTRAKCGRRVALNTKLVRTHAKVPEDHYFSLSLSQHERRHNYVK